MRGGGTPFLTASHLVRLSFPHLESVLFDWVFTPLGCPQSLSWVGAVVDHAGRVALGAFARPRSKRCVTLTRIISRDPSENQGLPRTKSRSTMHKIWRIRSITERWRAIRLKPESHGYYSSAGRGTAEYYCMPNGG